MKKVLFTATVDSHILHFHIPYLKYLHEQGYEVHVATNGTEEIPFCDKKIVIPFERSPYKVNNIKAIFQLKKVIEKEHYELIHTHTPMGSVVTRIAAKKARKRTGTKVLYTAHGFHFYKGAPMMNWLLFYPIEKILSNYTDTLITINKEDYELASKKFKKTNVKYVPGVGIDEEKFSFKMSEEEKKQLRQSLNLNEDDFVIIYPAELNKNKNQELLIQMMQKLIKTNSNFKLLLPGKDSFNGEYQKMIQKLELKDSVHILGLRNDIVKLLQISDLSVASSFREGLPMNVIEAMYIGLPVVATNCRGHRDLVISGETGYLVSFDTDNFIQKIIDISRDKKLYSKLSKNSKIQSERYSLTKVLKETIHIYENTLRK